MKDCYNNLGKAIDKIAYRHQATRVFDDLLEMTICAFSYGTMEERYLEIAKNYNPDEMNLFAHALGALVLDYENCATPDGGWDDVLGTYFETCNSMSTAQRMGQFFTPVSVCDLMAKIVQGEIKVDTTICDPCCGSGRNLIAHSRLAPSNRLKGMYFGMDLDRRCVNMCTINMVMYGLRGIVIHMNTITLEIYGGYRVYLPETGLGIRRMSIDECKTYVATNLIDDKIQKIKVPSQQITLF
jgi:type I restriction enzyme M protein